MIPSDLVIIGGGLTGLTLHYLLKKEGIPSIVVEARNRLGGRIYTTQNEGQAPIEMGATWLSEQHQNLSILLKELGLETFPQRFVDQAIYEPMAHQAPQLVRLPEDGNSSYRIKGGSSQLIDALAAYLHPDQLFLSQEVISIKEDKNEIVIKTNQQVFRSKMVVSTLPPALFGQSILVQPALPDPLLNLLGNTHTWMGESIKIGLSYPSPFWRKANTSGTIFSNVGPITEFYDHSNEEDSLYALKGFLATSCQSESKEQRLNLAMKQLGKYYVGEEYLKFNRYEEVVWSQEKYTYTPYGQIVHPHQNNGHPLFQTAYLNGKLILGGSETATQFSGYMEGAVWSAKHVFNQLIPKFSV